MRILLRNRESIHIRSKCDTIYSYLSFEVTSAQNVHNQPSLGSDSNVLLLDAIADKFLFYFPVSFMLLKSTFRVHVNVVPQFNQALYAASLLVHVL